MQYSVRTRRRLRPTTPGENHTRAAEASEAVVQPVLADGTGVTRRPLITGKIVERVSPRALVTAFRR